MIEAERVQVLNEGEDDDDGRYVLYWMQQAQREAHNPALEGAARKANQLKKPLVVGFGLTPGYPDANRRHYAFLLEGLAETAERIEKRGARFVARLGSPPDVILELAKSASLVVCDRGYLRHQVAWRDTVAKGAGRRVVQVEGDVVVPVDCVSDKQEYAARTIRRKINSRVDDFVRSLSATSLDVSADSLEVDGDIDLSRWRDVLDGLDIDHDVGVVGRFEPGTSAARKKLTAFLKGGLVGYADSRNDPSDPKISELSPYLHFGQISPVEIAYKVQRADGPSAKDKESFLEELIVRRELACNFVRYNEHYDSYRCLPDWAQKTLGDHEKDERDHVYTRGELEAADTHDPYWNAAMQEMLKTGYMHNHMRMYWGKKIVEWTNTPRYAFSTALYLNNKYFLDGRDPNSFASVAWLFGLHDRAWTERPVFGKIRYMNAAGLDRKFDIRKYVDWVGSLGDPGS